jgi:2-amino-4-hydroxy-6-hydroxymethyldihydropteridine diphosphokinase
MTRRAFISLGSNIDPEKHLPAAVHALSRLGSVVAVSSAYQNPAAGPTAQPIFLNAAALIETQLQAQDLRRNLRQLEAMMGRVRSGDKYAPRVIDLDLVILLETGAAEDAGALFEIEIFDQPHVSVPLSELSGPHLDAALTEKLRSIAVMYAQAPGWTLREDVTREMRAAMHRAAGSPPRADE